jgi:RHS repeat-associated protein
MATTYYHAVDGEIIGETTSGTRTHYLTDALGSVNATVDSSVAVARTYRYKPYGDTLAATGSGVEPKFQWLGSLGYQFTGRTQSEQYVRARNYGVVQGQWLTSDPLWPSEHAYGYVHGRPTLLIDPSGLRSCACKVINHRISEIVMTKGPSIREKYVTAESHWRGGNNACGACKDSMGVSRCEYECNGRNTLVLSERQQRVSGGILRSSGCTNDTASSCNPDINWLNVGFAVVGLFKGWGTGISFAYSILGEAIRMLRSCNRTTSRKNQDVRIYWDGKGKSWEDWHISITVNTDFACCTCNAPKCTEKRIDPSGTYGIPHDDWSYGTIDLTSGLGSSILD